MFAIRSASWFLFYFVKSPNSYLYYILAPLSSFIYAGTIVVTSSYSVSMFPKEVRGLLLSVLGCWEIIGETLMSVILEIVFDRHGDDGAKYAYLTVSFIDAGFAVVVALLGICGIIGAHSRKKEK